MEGFVLGAFLFLTIFFWGGIVFVMAHIESERAVRARRIRGEYTRKWSPLKRTGDEVGADWVKLQSEIAHRVYCRSEIGFGYPPQNVLERDARKESARTAYPTFFHFD